MTSGVMIYEYIPSFVKVSIGNHKLKRGIDRQTHTHTSTDFVKIKNVV
jgi:hypothetical protein